MKSNLRIETSQKVDKKGVIVLVVLGVFSVFAIAAIPLLLVWKESQITTISARHDQLMEQKYAAQKQIAALTVKAKRLSGTDRIESVARLSLGLEYPESGRIKIIHSSKKVVARSPSGPTQFWALLKKSFNPEERL